eukprot:scaffold85953_cov51-Phaeocystis_antarctica.AAC.1
MQKPLPFGSLEGKGGSKALAHELVNMFVPLGINESRFSVVSFAENATTRVGWSYDKSEIDNGIDNMTANGETSISDGFEAVRHLFDGVDDGDPRENATKIVLLLSDGEQTIDKATNRTLLQTAIDAATLVKGQGVTVFAWGFGEDVKASTLRQIATDPSKADNSVGAILARDIAELIGYLADLKEAICGDSQPTVGVPCPP